jgi:glycosyltransferase involved in cell wall biosynthesis
MLMDNYFPVAIFCYNRAKHLEQVVASLRKNKEARFTRLFIFSDGPKDGKDLQAVNEVRAVIRNVDGFKDVIVKKTDHNSGLAASIISGVSDIFEHYEACIVLEDDLEISPFFLRFMNRALHCYRNYQGVFSVSGYCPPIGIPDDYPYEAFRFSRINSWGWGTWRDRWRRVDWEVSNFNRFIGDKSQVKHLEEQGKDLPVMLLKQKTGKIGSWAVRFNQACFEEKKENIYPVQSFVRNIGVDGTGTNMSRSKKYSVELSAKPLSPLPAFADDRIDRAFRRFYQPSWLRQSINWVKIFCYLQSIR